MFKLKKIKKNGGMTYVELIVVLSIFATMSAIAIFNYGMFQDKVDIKTLASDIALQIVQAQKLAVNGTWNILAGDNWKPSYGVYFDKASNNKQFIYFVDLDYNGYTPLINPGETLNPITITKNNTISDLSVFYEGGSSSTLNDLTIEFTRPNSGAIFYSSNSFSPTLTISYVQITIASPKGVTALIKVYKSGRIQVN